MKRLCLMLLGVLCVAGCLDSKALGRLIQPHTEFRDPHAWDCSQVVQMPMAQGGIMGGGLTECTRCINHTSAVQGVLVRELPHLVQPGDTVHLCVNGRVMVHGVMTDAGSTRR